MRHRKSISIVYQCPSCGGPLAFEDDSEISSCPSCHSLLRLVMTDEIGAYSLESRLTETEARFLLDRELKRTGRPLIQKCLEVYNLNLPFFRLTGQVFSYRKALVTKEIYDEEGNPHQYNAEEQKVELKNWEGSFPAFSDNRFDLDSLGVRTAVLRLIPLTPKPANAGHFLKIGYGVDYALERYDRAALTVCGGNESNPRGFFSRALKPRLSIVYLPIWIINYISAGRLAHAVIDGVARRVVKLAENQLEFCSLPVCGGERRIEIQLVSHRCRNCGHDLPDQKRGEIFICGNCGRAYRTQGLHYEFLSIYMLSGKYKKISMFPFWMFRIAEPTLFEKRWAGLGLKSDTIFVPAFKMSNLRRMAMLTLYFSRKKQKINFDIIDQTCYNCFPSEVSRMEAERMIIPLLLAGGEDLNRINLDDFWCQAQFCREAVAVWLPFADDGLSYVAPFVDCGFEKAVLMR